MFLLPPGLFGGIGPAGSKVNKALDPVRERFDDDAIVKGRGFGAKLKRQGPRRWSESDRLQHTAGRNRSSSTPSPAPSFRPLQNSIALKMELQNRFTTPEFLRTRRAGECCVTAHLCSLVC